MIVREHRDNVAAVVALNPVSMFERGTASAKLLPGMDRRLLPLNTWIENYFSPLGDKIFQSDQEFRDSFDKLEFLWSLSYAHSIRSNNEHFWVPFGNFIYRSGRYEKLKTEVRASLATAGTDSPYIVARLFGSSVAECTEILDRIEPVAAEWARQRW